MSDLSLLSTHSLYEHLNQITLPASFINWGQTFTCRPLAVFEPEDEYQCELILELARREIKTLRAVGVGHSPSDLACTSGYMVRTTKLDKIYEVCPC
jgi:L-gulonolactone oxidase